MTDKTDREIMQQSLEALNYISRRDYDDTPLHDYELAKMRPAMSTLRERLAQPERERMSKMTDRELLEQAHDALYKEDRISGYANYGKLRKDLRERLAQPEPMQRFTDVQQEIEAVLAQPEREWQALTDEEISAISKSIPGETDLGAAKRVFARKIEAKLKEKNT
jgi:hypothetical protein